tara:strand:+ start:400 stop:714 length:315 start_codon:yes stop_codon:yes gene_type:complete
MSIFHNITGSTGVTVELIAPDVVVDIKGILLTNVHASSAATVTLFIENEPTSAAANTYNLIHTVSIPADSSLLLDDAFMFRLPSDYGLYITVGSSDTVDVMISN